MIVRETPEQAVQRAQQEVWTALRDKDPEAWSLVLAESFLARSPGEPDRDKAAFIDVLTSFPAEVISIGSENIDVRVWGETAVLTCTQDAQIQLPGQRVRTNRVALTNVFREEDGRWRLELTHAVALD